MIYVYYWVGVLMIYITEWGVDDVYYWVGCG